MPSETGSRRKLKYPVMEEEGKLSALKCYIVLIIDGLPGFDSMTAISWTELTINSSLRKVSNSMLGDLGQITDSTGEHRGALGNCMEDGMLETWASSSADFRVLPRGRHLSYQRGKRNTNPGTSLIKIEGVDDTNAAK